MVRAEYTESGWRAEVEIIEDNSDSEWYRYKLKVLKTHAVGIFGSQPDGHIFTVEFDKRYMIYCDWRLRKL